MTNEDIKSEIKRQQNEYNQLNKKIDQLIAEQIAASQKKKNNGQKTEKGSQSFKMSEEDVKLSGSFAANNDYDDNHQDKARPRHQTERRSGA